MKGLAAAVALWVVAPLACGSADSRVRKVDAAADGASRRDGGVDSASGADDGGGAARDSAPGRDRPALDGSDRLDAPWTGPDVPSTCHIDITPVTPATLVNLTAGPTAYLRVQGTVDWGETVPFEPAWRWSVTRSDGQTIPSKSLTDDPSQIQFPISLAGRYDIAVVIDVGNACSGSAHALVQDSANQFRMYHLRALPPASAPAAVPYEVDVRITADSTLTTRDIEFDTGAPVAIDPASGPTLPLTVAAPSAIRIQSTGSTWVTYGRSNHQGPFRAVLDLMLEYQVLIMPDPPSDGSLALPPFLLGRATSNDVKVDAQYIGAYANPLLLPQGIAISGHLLGPDGPAEGATISLHSYQSSSAAGQTDLLFSTVGRADSDGKYTLRVNPAGNFSVVLTPPPGSALPLATLEPGINLTEAAVMIPDVDFQWAALRTTDITLAVTLPDGSVPSDTVAVHLESPGRDRSDKATANNNPPPAGILTVGAGIDGGTGFEPRSAWPTVRRNAGTDRYGIVTFPALPKGDYEITLVPPPSLSGLGITKYKADTNVAAVSVHLALALGPKVMVMGRLLDAKDDATTDSAGSEVVATDLGHEITAARVVSQVTANGFYFLSLDPDRTYSLVARPVPGRGLPSYVPLYGFSTGRGNMQLDDQRIPKGVLVQGHITYAGTPVAGAVVQAFCVGLPPDCADRTNLAAGSPAEFAAGISDGSGSYAIYLPDPGTAE